MLLWTWGSFSGDLSWKMPERLRSFLSRVWPFGASTAKGFNYRSVRRLTIWRSSWACRLQFGDLIIPHCLWGLGFELIPWDKSYPCWLIIVQFAAKRVNETYPQFFRNWVINLCVRNSGKCMLLASTFV